MKKRMFGSTMIFIYAMVFLLFASATAVFCAPEPTGYAQTIAPPPFEYGGELETLPIQPSHSWCTPCPDPPKCPPPEICEDCEPIKRGWSRCSKRLSECKAERTELEEALAQYEGLECSVPEPDPVPMPPDPLVFAHFSDTERSRSELVLVNVSTTAVQPTVRFFNGGGEEIHTQTGAEINPGESWNLVTDGTLDTVGSVIVESDGVVDGYLQLDIQSLGRTTIGPGTAMTEGIFRARPDTGLAIRNLAEEGQVITCSVGDGTVGISLSIPTAGHFSMYLWELFDSPEGWVRCQGEDQFSAIAVEFDDGVFAAVPVTILRAEREDPEEPEGE